MATYQIELFGHVAYSPDLSYHDLLEREDAFKVFAQQLLPGLGADFLHFEAMGDALRLQCVFGTGAEDLFHRICDDLCPHMVQGLAGRLLFVDKDLHTLYYYSLSEGKWQEGTLKLPPAGHLEKTTPVTLGTPPPYVGTKKHK